MSEPDRQRPLVIVGIDAGDSRLLQEWGGDGTLPVVGNLLRRGCWGVTTGPELISEHGMWVTLTSGVSRAQHGYYYHRQLVPATHDPHFPASAYPHDTLNHAAGPQISGRGNLGELSPLDLVPTFLSLLNASPAPDLPGRPHAGILGASR